MHALSNRCAFIFNFISEGVLINQTCLIALANVTFNNKLCLTRLYIC